MRAQGQTYKSLFPKADDLNKNSYNHMEVGQFVTKDIQVCIHQLNQNLTYHRNISARSGYSSFLIIMEGRKVASVKKKGDRYGDHYIESCIREKLLKVEMPKHFSKENSTRLLVFNISCRLTSKEKSIGKKDIERHCKIESLKDRILPSKVRQVPPSKSNRHYLY